MGGTPMKGSLALNDTDGTHVINLIPEDAELIDGASIKVQGNCFKIFVPKYHVLGTGFSLNEAALNAIEQIKR